MVQVLAACVEQKTNMIKPSQSLALALAGGLFVSFLLFLGFRICWRSLRQFATVQLLLLNFSKLNHGISNTHIWNGIVSGNIRKALSKIGIKCIKNFTAYGDCNKLPKRVREGLQLTGVKVADVPHVKDGAADRAILNDMHLFASDNLPSATLVLISGDVDFAETLHKLGQRGHTIILLIPFGVGVSSVLLNAAEFVLDWPSVARGEGLVSDKPLMPSELKSIIESPTSNAWANTRPFYPLSYDIMGYPARAIATQVALSFNDMPNHCYHGSSGWGQSAENLTLGGYDVSAGPVIGGQYNNSAGNPSWGFSASPVPWDQYNDSARTSTSGRSDVSTGPITWGEYNVSADSAGPSAWEQYDVRGKAKII
ncbi:hypothetical protein NE237_020318 [Protea cynaroides]|uniref:NYN domain-containing protein n=1 Tax=Protea cynaroides TaxID=273540 RepID=A0A9Q0K3S3_9MAGN|nr:hypothetical protein NE237_020318 [Protea cynaroides]